MIIQEITDRQITTVETDVWSGGLGALSLILKRMNNTLDEINKKIQDPNSSS